MSPDFVATPGEDATYAQEAVLWWHCDVHQQCRIGRTLIAAGASRFALTYNVHSVHLIGCAAIAG